MSALSTQFSFSRPDLELVRASGHDAPKPDPQPILGRVPAGLPRIIFFFGDPRQAIDDFGNRRLAEAGAVHPGVGSLAFRSVGDFALLTAASGNRNVIDLVSGRAVTPAEARDLIVFSRCGAEDWSPTFDLACGEFARLGATLVNGDARTATCKASTAQAFNRDGLPHPRTVSYIAGTLGYRQVRAALGGPQTMILKPARGGTDGRHVALVSNPRIFSRYHKQIGYGTLVVAQVHVGGRKYRGKSFRVVCLNGRAVAGVALEGTGHVSNFAAGGVGRPITFDPALRSLASRATESVGLDCGGCDILRDRDGGYLCLEVNSGFDFAGLQQTVGRGIDIATLMIDAALDLHQRAKRAVTPLPNTPNNNAAA